jgi:hypothetical protein
MPSSSGIGSAFLEVHHVRAIISGDETRRRISAYLGSVDGQVTVNEIAAAVGCSVSMVMRALADAAASSQQRSGTPIPKHGLKEDGQR